MSERSESHVEEPKPEVPLSGETEISEVYPTPEEIEAAAQVGRDLIDHPEQVGVDRESEEFETWKSYDETRAKEALEKRGKWAYLKTSRQLDVDERDLSLNQLKL